MFQTARGGIIQDSAYGAVWAEARQKALTPAQCRSPLGRRPYDLRHAAVSLWLNSGVPAVPQATGGGTTHSHAPTSSRAALLASQARRRPRPRVGSYEDGRGAGNDSSGSGSANGFANETPWNGGDAARDPARSPSRCVRHEDTRACQRRGRRAS